MRIPHRLAAAVLAAALLAPVTARAQPEDFAALRESAQELAVRSRSAKTRIERARPDLRKDSERIVGTVDERRAAVETRLEVLALADPGGDAEAVAVREMRASLAEASRLLALVEGWFRPR